MYVNPTDAKPQEPPRARKLDNFGVYQPIQLRHEPVCSQKSTATASVPDQEFPKNELVPNGLFAIQDLVKAAGKRFAIRKIANPNRRID